MTIFLLRIFGHIVIRLPAPLLRILVVGAAEIILLLARSRRRLVMANLRHAFPERDDRWVTATGRKSIRQMVEFGLLAGVLPCLNKRRLLKIFSLEPESANFLREIINRGRPVLVLAPHVGPQDGLAVLPLLLPGMPPAGAIYRPINNQSVDTWIRESRERFGVKLHSRKEGLQNAIRMLRNNEWLCLLFDQNSSAQGALITFLDRVASTTELPGILGARHNAEIVFLHAARQAFWKIELRAEPGPGSRDRDEINFAANLWLERLLRADEKLAPGWLWAHNRWRHQRIPELSLRSKKNLLEKQHAFLGRDRTPRREPFFFRLPDSSDGVARLLPLLRAVRKSRPDAAVSVIGDAVLLPLVKIERLCEEAIPLPPRGPGYYLFFRGLARRYPSAWFVFHEARGVDMEAWLSGARHRFGIERPGRRRPLLNRSWKLPDDLSKQHETDPSVIWKAFLDANGLRTGECLRAVDG